MDDDDEELSGRAPAPDELTASDFAAMMGDQAPVEINSGADVAPPVVPSLPQRPHMDRGPGGSLLEQAATLDQDRRQIFWAADPRLWAAGLCFVGSGVVIVWGALGWSADLPSWLRIVVLILIGLAGFIATVMLIAWRLAPSQPAQRLINEAKLEQQVARAARLREPAWTLLADRLLPDSEHRVPLLAVGPAGVVLLPLLPPGPYEWSEDSVLVADGHALGPWLHTRMWEVRTLLSGLARSRSGRWPYSGPVHCVIVDPYPPLMVRTPDGDLRPAPHEPPGPPLVFAEVPIVPARHVGDHLAGLPGTLPAHVVADLRSQVQQLCPPAAQGFPETLPT